MPNPVIGMVGAQIGGSILGARAQRKAADKAADAQSESAALSVAEQRRQFDATVKLLAPYVEAGDTAIGGQLALLGLGGRGAQKSAIRAIERGVEFNALVDQGEEAILQNASATGGLRGGNTQAALAQFRPQMLANQINQQYSRLGGLTSIGQAAAAGQAAAGGAMANNVSNLMQQSGAAQAGAALASGRAQANMWGDLAGTAGQIAGIYQGGGSLF